MAVLSLKDVWKVSGSEKDSTLRNTFVVEQHA